MATQNLNLSLIQQRRVEALCATS